MSQMGKKSRGKNFIRVLLHSGTGGSPLGEEELMIFCKCNNDCEEPSLKDIDAKNLVRWVNKGFKKNQSNESYRISGQEGAMSVIFLNDREIESCYMSNRIYPSEC